jgi:hypothetical protein
MEIAGIHFAGRRTDRQPRFAKRTARLRPYGRYEPEA